MDLMIFVLTDDDIRLSRRIKRDIQERGRSVDDVLAQYNRFVKTSYDEFIKPTMKYADIIVPRGKSNTKGIEFVVNNLKLQIPQDDLQNLSQRGDSSQKVKKNEDMSPQPALQSIKEMVSPDPNMEGVTQLEKIDLKPKERQKLGTALQKLVEEQADEEQMMDEILIDYLIQHLIKDSPPLEQLQQQNQAGNQRRVYSIDVKDQGQPPTFFVPELLSKESIQQLADEVKVSCEDMLRVYTFVTYGKIQNSNIVANSNKSICISYLKLVDKEDAAKYARL